MQMNQEAGTKMQTLNQNAIIVKRDSDNHLFNFVWDKNCWLLKNNTEQTSLLFGTQFKFV